MNFLAQKRKKILLQETLPNSRKESPFEDFFYQQLAQLTGAGSYVLDFEEKTTIFDANGSKLLRVPESFKPSLNTNVIDFFAEHDKGQAIDLYRDCSMGTPFSTSLQMVKYDGQQFWAKIMGVPIFDAEQEIIGIKGIFQDISAEKRTQTELEKTKKTIASQNSRLYNYANLVSHNLRSHANNLELSLELLKDLDNPKDDIELISGLSTISNELCTTIEHLGQIVSIHDKAAGKKQVVEFSESLREAISGLRKMISESKAEIYTDFSEAPQIQYVPAYLVSILQNLISNAIQFRHPDRNPVIDIYTLENDGKITLVVKDNGKGFDVEAHKDRLFNIYETFHSGPPTRGIGLFMVKNQVDALDGTITVESEPNNGTVFKIAF
ncbi:MAG: PAS domain-containing sensor histidine kinase [Marinirhabdus sp.]|nr:PAS domain-containing sensor histidine kinase [Marinirhabdus sp.]